ncbi:hypothetical protein PXJ20_15105 [Paraburkholderia sp. A1RI_3L]|uniref:hypothetical protein n=1 Tax=Paraburkholderia TaxID=1822464 RepID=UPI003B7F3E79
MQYVFSMTSRMVTIAVSCALLLCLLLFLLGVEIGARMNRAPAQSADALRATPSATAPAPGMQSDLAAPSPLDTGSTVAAPASASSTL